MIVQNLEGDIHIPIKFNKLSLLGISGSPRLKNIYFDEPMKIVKLKIPKNGIKSINSSFQNLTKLKELTMFDNQLENIDLGYIPWVRKVGISNNPISFNRIDSLRLKYPHINIVSYSYKQKKPGNYINKKLENPIYE